MESFISAQNREDLEQEVEPDLEQGAGLDLVRGLEQGAEQGAEQEVELDLELGLEQGLELDLDAIVLALAATVPVQETAAQNRQNICMMVNAINYDTTFLFPHRYRHRNRVI